ncbi:hypothetical protein LY76DRAFT_598651 [Colletotrichum caudatum]|nr:hypothetical protein LY76DRAFT_598651 [Colletotrichum caudatum]
MFAYLCEYIRIERNQSLDIVLEKWLDDTRLSKRLWWNGRPRNIRDWKEAVDKWVMAGLKTKSKGIIVAKRRHKKPLSQRIIDGKYSCHNEILQGLKQQDVPGCLERELDFPDTDRIRTCILGAVRSSLGPIGSEWGTADAMCAIRMYQQCCPDGKLKSVVESFSQQMELGLE